MSDKKNVDEKTAREKTAEVDKKFLKALAIIALGSLGFLNLVGWAAAINWFAICLVFFAFRSRIWLGAVAAVVFLLLFVWPPIKDRSRINDQLALVENIEVQSEPIDLDGKVVLLLNARSFGIGALTEALVKYSGAATVYTYTHNDTDTLSDLPFKRFLDGNPIDLTSLDFGRLVQPNRSVVYSDIPDGEVKEPIDYVILFGLTSEAEKVKLLNRVNGTDQSRPFVNDWRQMDVNYYARVYAPDNLTEFRISESNLLFSAMNKQRELADIPYNPFAEPRGPYEYRFGLHEMALRVADVLCGPPEQPNSDICRRIGVN
ncbi:MAG: hypothetical protein ABJM43_02890 [Paracoccaceae bacterium]